MALGVSTWSPPRPLKVRKLQVSASFADRVLVWLMCLFQGTWAELPQQTHRWNNQRLTKGEVTFLMRKVDLMARVSGDPRALPRWLGPLPLFHMPILWGVACRLLRALTGREYVEWTYVVVRPDLDDMAWHPGWIPPDVAGVSRVLVKGPVRLLVGPGDVHFFGLDEYDRQLRVRVTGRGRVGHATPEEAKMPLL